MKEDISLQAVGTWSSQEIMLKQFINTALPPVLTADTPITLYQKNKPAS